MQARMSSVRPSRALLAISGSVIMARVMPHMSAWPLLSTCSAICGWLIRPATKTGLDTVALIAAASGAV